MRRGSDASSDSCTIGKGNDVIARHAEKTKKGETMWGGAAQPKAILQPNLSILPMKGEQSKSGVLRTRTTDRFKGSDIELRKSRRTSGCMRLRRKGIGVAGIFFRARPQSGKRAVSALIRGGGGPTGWEETHQEG